VIKNFSFPDDLRHPEGPRRIIETRLLIKESSGFTGYVYLWNDEQTDAELKIAGKTVPVSYIDKKGVPQDREYVVPNVNQCANCHSRNDSLRLLGPVTAQMNRNVERDGTTVNQLQWLSDQQFFSKELPTISTLDRLESPFGTGSLEKRARSYLHANCAHCHRSGGLAGSTGLHFTYSETDTTALGFCKRPVAAGGGTGGLNFDIVPGDPDNSIVVFRMGSTDPGVKMPELPNLLPDLDGIQLMRDWISSMTPQTCQ
ncbi:MAG: hypothetical protein KC609_22905, partial [Myxococcales bacterium]|nr:hypothetical protein [Myxococcales bacterium]